MPEHYDTIQAAMDAAAPGDTVWVSPGTYADVNETEVVPGVTIAATVIMKPGVTLLGRVDAPETVVIQGTDATQGIFCQDADAATVVAGVTVTGSRSGFMGWHASPVIHHCRFVDNQSEEQFNSGGGMYGDYFSPTVTDCLFAGNWAVSGAGATFANESFPVLLRCIFSGNHARNNSNGKGRGGGLTVVQDSEATLTDCTFTANIADSLGGAFHVLDSVVTLVGGTVTGNTAGDRGGAFFGSYGTVLHLAQVTVTGNAADEQGGGFFVRDAAVVTAQDCILRDNDATEGPDGFLEHNVETPSVTLTCCDIDPDGWVGDGLVIEDEDCD